MTHRNTSGTVSRANRITFQITADGYKAITTQIFDRETPYLENDSVFAVKDGLTVDFAPRKGDSKADWELEYNISMAPLGQKGESNVPLAPAGADQAFVSDK